MQDRLETNWTTVAVISAFLLPLALAIGLVPARHSFANAAAALLFIVIVVGCATIGNRLAGVAASISSAIWFDVFLTEPYGRLAISHRPDLETTLCLLGVGVIVTELAARSRHHLAVARTEADYVSMVAQVSELIASSAPLSSITTRTETLLQDLLGLRHCEFDPAPSARPVPQIQADGSVVHAGIRWPANEIGIPGPEAEIVVHWRGGVLGRFVLSPTPGHEVDVERRVVAASLVTMVAPALLDAPTAA